MKASAHKKHNLSDSRSMKLTSELLARTLKQGRDLEIRTHREKLQHGVEYYHLYYNFNFRELHYKYTFILLAS